MTEIRIKCIVNCPEGVCQLPMHEFPKDDISRNVWLKKLGLKRVKARSYVCNRHFSCQMRLKGRGQKLIRWAIPDINLPTITEVDSADEDKNETQSIVDTTEISDYEPLLNGHSETTNDFDTINDASVLSETTNNKSATQATMGEEEVDFDDLLAKVHCISDLPKNSTLNGYSENSMDSAESMEFDASNRVRAINGTLDDQISANEDTVSAPMMPIEINSRFKKKLIASVRRRRILYDPAHPSFSNIERKTRAWERIGKVHRLHPTGCRELWLNMRYEYQNYVRSLRRWLAGESKHRERPRMLFENDLLFLWRYIPDKSYSDEMEDNQVRPRAVECQVPGIPDKPVLSKEDESLLANDHARSVDHPYANCSAEEMLKFTSNLIEAVKCYSELYDPLHPNYGDCKRKSIIWEAISNEVKVKATKCLYTWINLTMRYEFEVTHGKSSYLVTKMAFLKKYILLNEKSPFKYVRTVINEWHEPLSTSHDQHLLLRTMISMKKFRPYLANIDIPNGASKEQPPISWISLSNTLKRKPVQCEITWVLLKTMYIEVTELRESGHPLREEWEYETVINNFKSTLSVTASSRPPKFPKASVSKPAAPKSPAPKSSVPKSPEPKPPVTKPPRISEAIEPISEAAVEPVIESVAEPVAEPIAAPISRGPEPAPNEIRFTIPGPVTDEHPTGEPQWVRFNLDTPLKDLPEKTIVEIGSVLPDAHIVLLQPFCYPPEIFLFTLQKRMQLIAEVMARPIVFNEPCKMSRLSRVFWGEISFILGFPVEICSFFWDYIMERSFFVDYDPKYKKDEPSKWVASPYPIFNKFQKQADSKEWREHIFEIAGLMREISQLPLLHVELKINSNWNRRQCYTRDVSEIWSILIRKFSTLDNHKFIWESCKKVFLQYMSDMQLSIYNPWPKLWSPVFEKLEFLCDLRYSPKSPIYYVIKHKIKEEIEEYRKTLQPPIPNLDPVSRGKIMFRLLKNDDEYLHDFTWVNRARFAAKLKTLPVLYDVNHPLFGNKEEKINAWQEMAIAFHCTVGECHLIFQHLMKGFLLYHARDPNQVCRVNAKYWENMTFIYACAVPNALDPKLIEGRSFRPNSSCSTIKLAEEYQADISLREVKPSLVLKNFASAVNSLPMEVQPSVMQQIKYTFATSCSRGQNEDIVVDV